MSNNKKILFVYTGPANQYDEDFSINQTIYHRLISRTLKFPRPLTFPILAAITPKNYEISLVEGGVNDVDFNKKYDLVGISCTTRFANSAYKIADEFQRRNIKVVLGGYHPSALPDEAKEHADSVAIGEAEETWPLVLRDSEKNKLKPFYLPNRPVDPSIIKCPRYDIYPSGTEFGVLATRGCPYGCKFCAISNMELRKKFRTRPVEDVVEEIKQLPGKMFSFQDNSFTIDVNYSKKLFKAMRGINKKFIANGNIGTLGKNDELLKLAREAGCVYWYVGFESVSQESLDNISKITNRVKDYFSSVKKIHDMGMAVSGSFVLGFDGDRKDIFEKTKEFVRISEIDIPDAGVLTPFPGTPIFDQYEAEGRMLSKNWDDYDFFKVIYKPKHMTPQELFDNTNEINMEWLTTNNNIRRIFRSLKFGITASIETLLQLYYLKFTRAKRA